MKGRKVIAIGLATMMTLSLVACGTNKNSEKGNSKSLVIYTNSGSNGRDSWLKEKAKKAGFDIEVVQIQGGDLGNRIISEKNNVQADLVFGLNNVEYEKLKAEDTLEKWEPEWKKDVDMSLGDADGYYYPLVIQPLVNIMNANLKNPPQDYTDLIKEEWKDKYTILNFGGGTGKTILASLLVRYQDKNGEYGISDEGWKFVKKWIQNGHMETEGEDSVGAVIDGSRPVSEMWGSGVLQYEKERNYKFSIMVPEIGVPYVTEQIALLKGSNKKEQAIEFANWFGSSEIQKEWMNEFGTIPCQPSALENASEEVKGFTEKVHQQDINWEFVAKHLDQWVEKVELEFVG